MYYLEPNGPEIYQSLMAPLQQMVVQQVHIVD